MTTPVTTTLNAVWGASANDFWAVGDNGPVTANHPTVLHFNGLGWTAVTVPGPTLTRLMAIRGSGPNDVYAVGTNGLMLRYSGTWSVVSAPFTSMMLGVSVNSPTDIHVVGDLPSIFSFDGLQWTSAWVAGEVGWQFSDVWAAGNHLYVAGTCGSILRKVR